MFAEEFQTRLCGRTNILHDTVDAKRESKKKNGRLLQTSRIYLFFISATKNGAAEIWNIAGWNFFILLRVFASIKISCKLCKEGGEKKGSKACGMVKIRSKILLICHFSLLFPFVWNLFIFFAILQLKILKASNLTGTIVR